jgi:lysophospholipase L1-like esterase
VASGEGNPAPGLFRWQSPSWCHRSATSGQAIAARALIAAHPDSSLEFVSFACSGATIDRGLLGEFKKGSFRGAELAQLDRIAQLPATDVDALMISIGANDVGFQRIVTFCTIKDRCPTNRSFPPAVEWAAKQHVPVPTLDRYVTQRIAELGRDYDRVNARIPSAIDRRHVLIVEYFDPTRWPVHRQCPVFDERVIRHPEEGLVTTAESSWAHDHVLIQLNEAIHAGAQGNGWTVVDGVDERFDGHGICAPKDERWVRTLPESLALQHNISGTLHPNSAGHEATAALIKEKLASVLGLD